MDANYINYQVLKGLKRSTAIKNARNVEKLQKWGTLTKLNVETCFSDSLNQWLSARYLNILLDSLKSYLHYLDDSKISYDPSLKEIKYLKEKPFERSTMSDEEIEAFLALPHPKNNIRIYNIWTLFFSILSFTGMRCGECAKLTVNDVDLGRSVFTLRDTKTNDTRLVPIPQRLLKPITDHLATLQGDYLFPSERGGKKEGVPIFDNVDWHYNFHSRIKRLGIKRTNLSPYSLRHSLITRLLEEDVNLFKVQKLVGHRRIETTAVYTHMTTKDVARTIAQDRMNIKYNDPHLVISQIKTVLEPFKVMKSDNFECILTEQSNGLTFKLSIKNNNTSGAKEESFP